MVPWVRLPLGAARVPILTPLIELGRLVSIRVAEEVTQSELPLLLLELQMLASPTPRLPPPFEVAAPPRATALLAAILSLEVSAPLTMFRLELLPGYPLLSRYYECTFLMFMMAALLAETPRLPPNYALMIGMPALPITVRTPSRGVKPATPND